MYSMYNVGKFKLTFYKFQQINAMWKKIYMYNYYTLVIELYNYNVSISKKRLP